jgi:FkbM family methyltransferase
MTAELLSPKIKEVYDRLSANALRDGDIVDAAKFPKKTPVSDIKTHLRDKIISDQDALIFSSFTPDMGIIVDAGAHWGYMASSIRLTGTRCNILSFEAIEAHRDCLEFLKLNDPIGYDYRISALSDAPREVILYGPVINNRPIYGLNSVDGAVFNDWHQEYLVSLVGDGIKKARKYKFQLMRTTLACLPLDKMLLANDFAFNASKIAAIKLDVEGHEPQVLRGAKDTIARNLPFIMVEGANRVDAVVQFLTSFGYRFGYRFGNQLIPSNRLDLGSNGYWFHPQHEERYRAAGLLAA